MENSSINLENDFESNKDEGQFFIELFNTIRRQKKYFISVGFLTFLLIGLVFTTKQRLWQGDFQIVISQSKKKNPKDTLMNDSSDMLNLVGIGSSKNRLFTEVKILESPSVLMPVFEMVNKRSIEEDGTPLKFKVWLENRLSIDILRKTSILNISYKDNDREFVKDVLEKLSSTYQEYSSRDRNTGINQSIKYLDNQISLYKKRSQESLKAEQAFSAENDLSTVRTINDDVQLRNQAPVIRSIKSMKAFENKIKIKSQINVEELGFRYKNELRELRSKLSQVKALNEENSGDFLVRKALVPELASKAQYKSWRDEATEYLESRIQASKAKLSTLERPEGVLIKYRELLRTNESDNEILKTLIEERQRMRLEKARAEDPWELISSPYVAKKPVSPSKKNYFLFGVFSSFVLGSLAAKYKEKKMGVVFSISELKRRIPAKYLGSVKIEDFEKKESVFNTIIDNSLEDKKPISIFFIGFKDQTLNLKNLNNKYKDEINKGFIKFSKDYKNASQDSNHIIVSKAGGISLDEINKLRQHYLIRSKEISGHLIF